jgi:hypothetical protein
MTMASCEERAKEVEEWVNTRADRYGSAADRISTDTSS